MARISPRRMIVSGLVVMTALALWSLYLRPLTALPTAYRKGSEMYYLSWVEHGAFGQQGAAARALLDLPEKRQYERTRALYRRQWWGPIRWMLLLRLFEMAPSQNKQAVVKLMQSDGQDDAGEGWVKTDDEFEGQVVDFYFDGPGEAALRLVQHGVLSPQAIKVLSQYACDFYPDNRLRARKVFDRFEGIPAFDPRPQPKTINEKPLLTVKQVRAIWQWFSMNRRKLRWSETRKAYYIAH